MVETHPIRTPSVIVETAPVDIPRATPSPCLRWMRQVKTRTNDSVDAATERQAC
jgi:hypothetical protein